MNGKFTIIDSGYRNNTHKRKIAYVPMIKAIIHLLNDKEKSVELELLN